MLRPQLMTGLIGLILVGGMALILGALEVAATCVGGMIGIGMKLLEVK